MCRALGGSSNSGGIIGLTVVPLTPGRRPAVLGHSLLGKQAVAALWFRLRQSHVACGVAVSS